MKIQWQIQQFYYAKTSTTLGGRGEIVKVKAGYARNYLLPQGFATLATKGNVKQIEQERAALLKKAAVERATAEAQQSRWASSRSASNARPAKHGTLFGSVTSMDIAEPARPKATRSTAARSSFARRDQGNRRIHRQRQASPRSDARRSGHRHRRRRRSGRSKTGERKAEKAKAEAEAERKRRLKPATRRCRSAKTTQKRPSFEYIELRTARNCMTVSVFVFFVVQKSLWKSTPVLFDVTTFGCTASTTAIHLNYAHSDFPNGSVFPDNSTRAISEKPLPSSEESERVILGGDPAR